MKTNLKHLFLPYTKGCIISTLLLTSLISCSDKKEESHKDDVEKKSVELNTPANTTLEELGASFVLAIKKNDPTNISEFLPTKEDVENIILTYEGTEKEKKSMLANSEENTKTIKSNTFNAVDKITKAGKEVGINWEEASYAGVEQKIKTENKTESADILIKISYKNLI